MVHATDVPIRPRPSDPSVDLDGDRAARRALRGQVERLERALAEAQVDGAEAARVPFRSAPERPQRIRAGDGPRLLSLGALERLRDELVDARAAAERHGERLAANRRLLQAMREDPAAHRWRRLRSAELGEPGCRTYEVVPCLGPIGLLTGWWRVKVSSGCPLRGAAPWRRTLARARPRMSGWRACPPAPPPRAPIGCAPGSSGRRG